MPLIYIKAVRPLTCSLQPTGHSLQPAAYGPSLTACGLQASDLQPAAYRPWPATYLQPAACRPTTCNLQAPDLQPAAYRPLTCSLQPTGPGLQPLAYRALDQQHAVCSS